MSRVQRDAAFQHHPAQRNGLHPQQCPRCQPGRGTTGVRADIKTAYSATRFIRDSPSLHTIKGLSYALHMRLEKSLRLKNAFTLPGETAPESLSRNHPWGIFPVSAE
jgi:hypothetical protein